MKKKKKKSSKIHVKKSITPIAYLETYIPKYMDTIPRREPVIIQLINCNALLILFRERMLRARAWIWCVFHFTFLRLYHKVFAHNLARRTCPFILHNIWWSSTTEYLWSLNWKNCFLCRAHGKSAADQFRSRAKIYLQKKKKKLYSI